MGNRALIATKKKDLELYLHWNGGRDSVCAFLTYCLMLGIREPEEDGYGWARLCQIVGNFFGGDLSVGIEPYNRFDPSFCDNGRYIIEGWRIIGREYAPRVEGDSHDLLNMLIEIDSKMPEYDRRGEEYIKGWLAENKPVE